MRGAILLGPVLAIAVAGCGERGTGAPAEDEAVPVPAESELTAPELGTPILATPGTATPAAGGAAMDGTAPEDDPAQ